MNASKKSAAKQSEKRIKGSLASPETRQPNSTFLKSSSPIPNYHSMWKAIQKIAHPVSFDFLKKFYNIGQK